MLAGHQFAADDVMRPVQMENLGLHFLQLKVKGIAGVSESQGEKTPN